MSIPTKIYRRISVWRAVLALLLLTLILSLNPPIEAASLATRSDPQPHPLNQAPPESGTPLAPGTIISNGTVQLGLNTEGNLIIAGGTPSPSGTTNVGLRYVPTNGESTAQGSRCEGWGIADSLSGVNGYANIDCGGTFNVVVNSYTSTSTDAVSDINIGSTFHVVQNFHPSAVTPFLYEVDITITNISATDINLLYRRAMDWDTDPTPFSEYVTIHADASATDLIFSSDQGFANPNPLVPAGSILFTGTAVDSGPADHGAVFDFDFGTLASGASRTFQVYYGAAGTEADALAALTAVGAQVYSLGQCDSALNASCSHITGTPNTYMFGFAGVGGSSISDFVWEDADTDGIQDGGETGINGVTVRLYEDVDGDMTPEPGGDDGAALATTVTANNGFNGFYTFGNLLSDAYFLEFVLPTNFSFSPQNQGGDDTIDSDADPSTGLTAVFTLPNAVNDTTRDAGLYGTPTALVGDYVWADLNGNGLQDGSETGLNGVSVSLYQDNGDNTPDIASDYLIETTTTANDGTQDGAFVFDQLAEGNYFIHFTLPAIHIFSPQDQGGDDTVDSDANPATGLTAIFFLADAATDNTRDAGLVPPAVMGDYVWEDSNTNHIQDGGENGINGITVRIYRDNGDNIPNTGTDTLVATTTTANDGSNDGAYQFVVEAGAYFIEFVPGARLLALPDQGGDDALDSDANPATGLTAIYNLAPGNTNLTVDAGMSASSSCNVAVVGTGGTGNDAGYNLTVNQLNDDSFYNFTATRVNPTDVDTAAELSAYDAVVIGWTFEATNYTIYQSALQTWVEAGGGVVGLGFLDWQVPASTNIDAIIPINMVSTGQYVGSGSVVVTTAHPVTQGVSNFTATDCYVEYPAGASPYLDTGATGLATTSGIPSVAISLPVNGRSAYLGPAYTYEGCGAGLRTGHADHLLENAVAWAGSCGTPTLGNYVWRDDNLNGIQDVAEVGLNGITVNLYRDVDYDSIAEPGGDDGAPINTTTTANNGTNDGFYQFTSAPGYYFLEFVPSSAQTFSLKDQGGDDSLDSDVNPVTGLTDVFAFATTNDTKDAGFIPGVVWDGGGTDNNWSTGANWVGDLVPMATDVVIFNTTSTKNSLLDAGFAGVVQGILIQPGYTGIITMDRSLQVSNNYWQSDGTFVVTDPAIALLTVGGVLTHEGGILQQSRPVNNANVPFLLIDDGAAAIKYRGVNVDTTISGANLGSTLVSIRAIGAGQYCTNTSAASPVYAERCYQITPTTDGAARVRLWALTSSELNGITEVNLSVYRNFPIGNNWVELTTNRTTGNDGGSYSYAEGDTPGFSHFLLGQTAISPTAITVQSMESQINQPTYLVLILLLLVLLAITIKVVWRRIV